MADEKQKQEKQQEKQAQQKRADRQAEKSAQEGKERRRPSEDERSETLIRILGFDIPGSKNIYTGLTRIKGISWAISNAVCLKLGIPRNKRIQELSKPEIQKVETFLKELPVYDYQKNRRSDLETGKTGHFYGSDLDVLKDFDIKRQKKIRSYVGLRHAQGQPVRGQRTRSHFRKKKVVKAGKKAVKK